MGYVESHYFRVFWLKGWSVAWVEPLNHASWIQWRHLQKIASEDRQTLESKRTPYFKLIG